MNALKITSTSCYFDAQYTGAAEKWVIIKTVIQTLHLQNYKNILFMYTTKPINFLT